VKMIFHFYHSVVKAELKRRGFICIGLWFVCCRFG